MCSIAQLPAKCKGKVDFSCPAPHKRKNAPSLRLGAFLMLFYG
ncbi:hypothetical protein HMPREF0372_03669 [Flavonifractor plautii ATCC 29863]|uniref:Uncharacterized protein n=1 Tax=Flavonifractor plautii ATCC 29863 TaxID=411475 RepID=G9YVX8_FLAPL|nr:hypothetical protein HMPREF0372_03669 [Flavonifractor plautii ATCC 29863]